MELKTLLNHVHPIRGFVYGRVQLEGGQRLNVEVRPRRGSRPRCSRCGKRRRTKDTARRARAFRFIPVWGVMVFLLYRMRRADCPRCGVTVEMVPWSEGKQRTCYVYRQFLAFWARRLSWSETSEIFGVSWGVVYRAVRWVVDWGLAHRSLTKIRAIGVDEIAVWRATNT